MKSMFLSFNTRVTLRPSIIKEVVLLTAFLVGLILLYRISAKNLFSSQDPASNKRNHEPPRQFASLCGNLGFLPTLTNWTVDRWLDISPEEHRWWKISDVFTFVGSPYFNTLKPFKFVSEGETKYFAEFLRPDEQCNVITLGVGYNIDGELKLFRRFPQCKLLALDPEEKGNREIVERVNGQFVQGAIGFRTGDYSITMRVNKTQRREVYKTLHDVTFPHIGLADFLKKYNGDKMIDLMNIDVEGGEFGLLRALHEDAHMLPTICQFNMELHYSPQKYHSSMFEFTDAFVRLLKDGRYMLINVDRLDRHKFHRMFFLNIKDRACVEKFICRE